jgi:two-component system sensor histidine kinase UhpB
VKTTTVARAKQRSGADGSGREPRAVNTAQSVGARENALSASNSRYAALYDNSPVAMISVDSLGTIRECNISACTMLGRVAQRMIGLPLLALAAKQDLGAMLEHLRCLRRGDRRISIELRLRHVRTGVVTVQLHSVREDPVDPEAWFETAIIDVTEQRRVEEALRASEARYRNLVERASDLICELDAAGRIEFVNSAVVKKELGFDEIEVIGRPFIDFVPAAHRSRVLLALVRARGSRNTYFELPVSAYDGREVWLGFNVLPVIFQHRLTGYHAVGRDITQSRQHAIQRERRVDQARELTAHLRAAIEEERTRIARNVHDELGATLTAVKFALAQARKKARRDAGADIAVALDDASAHVDAAMAAVRKIASDLRPSVLDHLGLWAAIGWLADDFGARTGIRCEVEQKGELPRIDGDTATAIFRIVQESLTNVVRHSKAGRVTIRSGRTGDAAYIEIVDNGRGISAEAIASQRSLGLLGMRERATHFGGEVAVSGNGSGTTVRVNFPQGGPP